MSNFNINRLRSVAKNINKIEDSKLTLLATRIAQHLVVSATNEPFTPEEISKLEHSFGIDHENVLNVVGGLVEVLLESAYHKISPSVLQNHLANTELDENKQSVLVSVWTKVMTAICDSLGKRSILPQVSHVSYNLALEAGSDVAASEKHVRARLQVGLKNGNSTEVLDLEFDHDGLYDFHSQLTRIQSQLDAIADK